MSYDHNDSSPATLRGQRVSGRNGPLGGRGSYTAAADSHPGKKVVNLSPRSGDRGAERAACSADKRDRLDQSVCLKGLRQYRSKEEHSI
jgi:hypothetical protein